MTDADETQMRDRLRRAFEKTVRAQVEYARACREWGAACRELAEELEELREWLAARWSERAPSAPPRGQDEAPPPPAVSGGAETPDMPPVGHSGASRLAPENAGDLFAWAQKRFGVSREQVAGACGVPVSALGPATDLAWAKAQVEARYGVGGTTWG